MTKYHPILAVAAVRWGVIGGTGLGEGEAVAPTEEVTNIAIADDAGSAIRSSIRGSSLSASSQ
jgi:hypothetical protein